jgi:hypothetical protein
MKVFVLGTGRSGTKTFAKACEYLTNYSVSHNTLREGAGFDHKMRALESKDHHIEVDDRLSWLLPVLERLHGADAYYVHLWRDPGKVVRSYTKPTPAEKLKVSASDAERAGALCVEVINKNIEHFLAGKPHQIFIDIDRPAEKFRRFLEEIGAEGDLDAAVAEFEKIHDPEGRSRLGYHIRNFIYEAKLLMLRAAGRMSGGK